VSTTTVYVRLLDEGTDVFRPTEAEYSDDGLYRLRPTADYDPADERWEFLPGAMVRCQIMNLYEGERLVVVALA